MKKASLLLLVCFATLSLATAEPHQAKAVPPPPKPADEAPTVGVAKGQQSKPSDNGPSLEATMKFIQDKLNEVEKVQFVAYHHNNTTGGDSTDRFIEEVTNVVADSAACHVGYHSKSSRDGGVTLDADLGFDLKDVEKVIVMSREQDFAEFFAAGGLPPISSRVNPPVFVLRVERSHHGRNSFDFLDEDLANRVAKALIHGVELCGGGSKDPF